MEKFKQGFTLIELLMSMMIIGIIATLLMVAINNSMPNREMVLFKKAYNVAGNAIYNLINDDNLYPYTTIDERMGFRNIDEVGYKDLFHRYDSKFCTLMAAIMNVQGDYNCSNSATLDNGGTFTTVDGMTWVLPLSTFEGDAGNWQVIHVDVNGPNEGQNCSHGASGCTKPDRFSFRVRYDGKMLVTEGSLEQYYLSNTDIKKDYQDYQDYLSSKKKK